ncbi:MAG: GFA family protein [Myxococcaceae bacterium]
MSLRTHHGSCHCGAVKFEAQLDLAKGAGRCNCTFCLKARLWGQIVKPDAFKLLSGADALTTYKGANNAQGEHLFCKHCGVRAFERGYLEVIGGAYVTVAVNCLDDIGQDEMAAMPIQYFNGRDNAWQTPPKFTAHL